MIPHVNDKMGMSSSLAIVHNILEWKHRVSLSRVHLTLLRVFVTSACNFHSEPVATLPRGQWPKAGNRYSEST